jgi:hypothetical protein
VLVAYAGFFGFGVKLGFVIASFLFRVSPCRGSPDFESNVRACPPARGTPRKLSSILFWVLNFQADRYGFNSYLEGPPSLIGWVTVTLELNAKSSLQKNIISQLTPRKQGNKIQQQARRGCV